MRLATLRRKIIVEYTRLAYRIWMKIHEIILPIKSEADILPQPSRTITSVNNIITSDDFLINIDDSTPLETSVMLTFRHRCNGAFLSGPIYLYILKKFKLAITNNDIKLFTSMPAVILFNYVSLYEINSALVDSPDSLSYSIESISRIHCISPLYVHSLDAIEARINDKLLTSIDSALSITTGTIDHISLSGFCKLLAERFSITPSSTVDFGSKSNLVMQSKASVTPYDDALIDMRIDKMLMNGTLVEVSYIDRSDPKVAVSNMLSDFASVNIESRDSNHFSGDTSINASGEIGEFDIYTAATLFNMDNKTLEELDNMNFILLTDNCEVMI